MFDKFQNKKLLFLGGNSETVNIVETAQKMGIKTVVTDNLPNSPAKKICDKSYDIDATDVDSLYDMAVREKVDGVMVGVADSLIVSYQQLCERLGVPCYANAKSAGVLTNKRKFKDECSKYGIKGVPEYSLDKREDIQYPVIVKPVDNSASKGITVCHSDNELDEAVKFAKSNSKTGNILIERYMQCCDLSIYYTIVDGKPYLSSISDRFTLRTQNANAICIGDVFPSNYYDEFMTNENCKFVELCEGLGIQYGVLYVSAFYENGEFYVYDPGFRLQGGGFHLILNAVNGFDQRKMLIEFALTGKMDSVDFCNKNDPLMRGGAAAVIWYLLKEGTIAYLDGVEYMKSSPFVVDLIKRFKLGDCVTSEMIGTERQVFIRAFLKCSNKSELKNVVRDFHSKIKVESEKKENMLLPSINIDEIEDTSTNLY